MQRRFANARYLVTRSAVRPTMAVIRRIAWLRGHRQAGSSTKAGAGSLQAAARPRLAPGRVGCDCGIVVVQHRIHLWILYPPDRTLLKRPGMLYAVLGPGFGLQPRLGDRLVRRHANPIGALGDAVQGLIDLAEQGLLVAHQADGEFLLEIVAAGIGWVERHAGQVAGGLLAVLLETIERGDVANQSGPA